MATLDSEANAQLTLHERWWNANAKYRTECKVSVMMRWTVVAHQNEQHGTWSL